MAKALVNIMIVCLIFSVLSIVMTSGNDDIAKAKAEAEAAAAEAEAAVAKAKAAAEAEAEAEELDTSLPSFSTSAALSFDDDFIAPDISAGKAPVNCVIGPWTNEGGCDENTGVQKQKRLITPAKYGGTCEVSADDTEQNVECRVRCKGNPDANWSDWSGCTVAGQSCGRSGTEYKYWQKDPAQDVAWTKGLVDTCPAALEQACYTPACVIGYYDNAGRGDSIIMQDGDTAYIGDAHNDRLSSLIIPENTWVQAYQHANYGGVCEPFDSRNEPRTTDFGQLNNEVSSYKVGRGLTQPCPGTNTSQTGTNAAPVSSWGSY